jgi:hypothetical protein
MAWSSGGLFNGNVEVIDGFFYAEGFVEADGGVVYEIGLDEDYVGVFSLAICWKVLIRWVATPFLRCASEMARS